MILAAIAWLFAATGFLQKSEAATIVFTASDLEDTTAGQDLWQYRWTVSDLSLNAGQGFTLFFDLGLYSLLQSPPPPANAGWDLLTVQPDSALDSDGFFDAQALENRPSLASAFTLTFVWLGAGLPGAQPFTVYNPDFSTVESGMTQPPAEPPEPLLLSIQRRPDGVSYQIEWSPGSALLEESTDLESWTLVPGAASPHTVTPAPSQQRSFYRLRPAP